MMKTKKKDNRMSIFLRGMASAFDLSGRSGIVKINRRSDTENLRSDWERIGSDFYNAISKTQRTITK